MLIKRKGLPEPSEIVMCTVSNVSNGLVTVNIDEYENQQGLISISEISPGRIRNIRDYVKEGKKIVCKVLTVNKDKKHVDLSLRRVSESQRREKVDELKHEKIAEGVVESAAKELKADTKKLYKKIWDYAEDTVYQLFEDVTLKGEKLLEKVGLEKKETEILLKYINQRIKPPVVEIVGKYNITTYKPEGADWIKKVFEKAVKTVKGKDVVFKYLGSSSYSFMVRDNTYKQAEKTFDQFNEIFEKEFSNDTLTEFSIDRQKKSQK